MTAKQLDQDLIDHACGQLHKAARRLVQFEGMGPASAARKAIRETKSLFPPDWHLAVQGDDDEEFVEVWEVEHKRTIPCARVSREVVPERAPTAPKPRPKRARATKRRVKYDINPTSPDVIKAFKASGQPATYLGIQEFISDRYGGWMRNLKRRYPDVDATEEWATIQRELTEALERSGIEVAED